MQILALYLDRYPSWSNLYVNTHISGRTCFSDAFGRSTGLKVPRCSKERNSFSAAARKPWLCGCLSISFQFFGSGGNWLSVTFGIGIGSNFVEYMTPAAKAE